MYIDAFAKINWTLDVTGKRPDGYHYLDTIMQTISLSDTIEIEPADEIDVLVDCTGVPNGTANLAHSAAQAYFNEAGIERGARIHITKRIPSAAGLGGGSTDAAAVFRALEHFFGPLCDEKLRRAAVSIGADVTFCLYGGLARATGIGEVLEHFEPKSPIWLLLVKPENGVPTAEVFKKLELPPERRPQTERALKALVDGDANALCGCLFNALEPVACTLVPEIAQIKREMLERGALCASMSGSGSSVFGVFEDKKSADIALESFRHYDFAMVAHTI